MGLDSVELLMDIEDYFGVSIPNAEAEKITTVQDMVDVVAKHLRISSNRRELQERVFLKVNQALIRLQKAEGEISMSDPISRYISSGNDDAWTSLNHELQLKVLKPDTASRASERWIDSLKSSMNWVPQYDWFNITVGEFIDAVCAMNYETLIDRKTIASTYEIYVAVIGITVVKVGVDYYEVRPEKSFTADLGVD